MNSNSIVTSVSTMHPLWRSDLGETGREVFAFVLGTARSLLPFPNEDSRPISNPTYYESHFSRAAPILAFLASLCSLFVPILAPICPPLTYRQFTFCLTPLGDPIPRCYPNCSSSQSFLTRNVVYVFSHLKPYIVTRFSILDGNAECRDSCCRSSRQHPCLLPSVVYLLLVSRIRLLS